jgi:hypothetical protein
MAMVERSMCQEARAVQFIPTSFIRFPSECKMHCDHVESTNFYKDYGFKTTYGDLKYLTLSEIRYNWALLKVFNKYLHDCVNLFNVRHDKCHLPHGTISLSATSALTKLRSLVMLPIKNEL